MKLGRRAFVFVALAGGVPLAILAACGSNNFSSDDSDAAIISAGDASFPLDANSGSDVDAAPPPPTWCQTNQPNAFFCADFDESDVTRAYDQGTLKSMFTVTIQDAGVPGEVVGLADAGNSEPSSLLTYEPLATSFSVQDPETQVSITLADKPKVLGFQLDFDLNLQEEGNLSAFDVMTFDLSDKTNLGVFAGCDFSITGATRFENGANGNNIGPIPTVGVWTHYRVVITLNGPITVQIDDGGIFDAGASGAQSTTTQARFSLGQSSEYVTQPAGNTTILFDNVVMTALEPDAGDGG